ncbi:MAG: hypothetical protein DME59_00995 [Verrucomicrobia bacterium]|nr:MAG: hypothetical protein DME59_00995 [Verrucomicrobiota bacterium]PYL77136.1 MAG: hypothetical protein DMF26_04865 [Verrucomicrobiota bacterium]
MVLPAAKALPFLQGGSDLKPDPAARFGALANGLRYVVLPNHEPKGRVSMRLLVLAGSLQEKEGQRGLAHFLEHMAFNGSTHYAPTTSPIRFATADGPNQSVRQTTIKYWEIITDNLGKAGWTWGCVSAVDCNRRTDLDYRRSSRRRKPFHCARL